MEPALGLVEEPLMLKSVEYIFIKRKLNRNVFLRRNKFLSYLGMMTSSFFIRSLVLLSYGGGPVVVH